MKTLLVLAKQSGLAAAIRATLDSEQYRVLGQGDLYQAESALQAGAVDACVLDADLTDIQPIRLIKQIRRLAPRCPILIYAALKQWEWDEEAYLLGVAHVLAKPVRARLLSSLLDRLWQGADLVEAAETPRRIVPQVKGPEPAREPVRTLEALRHFSGILTHSLCSEALLKQVLALLREILEVNRAAIFLRQPPGLIASLPAGRASRRLRAACALGLPASLLENLDLSLEAGIGRYLYRSGRILKSGSDEARGDLEIQKEFELLGTQVAIPILDRESLVGVAVFDGRLTGEFFANEELALIFHLLEEVGLALKNSWLYDQLAANHAMMVDVLNQLNSGCVVVSGDLAILHANPVAQRMLGPPAQGTLDFGALPASLASQVFEALKTGVTPPSFLHRPSHAQDTVYRVTITPFRGPVGAAAHAVLLTLEDFTSTERSQRLETEAANLRLIRSMASHLAHEIGNSLVPIITSHQLRAPQADGVSVTDPLGQAADAGIQRIVRLTQQMRFLARETAPGAERLALIPLIQEAFQAAQAQQTEPAGQLQCAAENPAAPLRIQGDRGSLKHALLEVLLNALQASPPGAPVQVNCQAENRGADGWVHIDVADAGSGFTPEAARRASEPFFSTRPVGLGLGLTVACKILEMHQGRLEILPAAEGQAGRVRISLPSSGEGDDTNGNGRIDRN